MSSKPIGIFDSGVGGLSIWKEIHQLLPMESTHYLSDSKNAPYGPKGKEAIIALSIKNTEWLINQGCKLVVVACNTATTNAIDLLRNNYAVPFIGIEPAIKPAALESKSKAIGILATKGTLSSQLFHKTSQLYSNELLVIEQEGNGIVELIETGGLHSVEMLQLLQSYLNPMLKANIDCLVLGCTHYHFLTPILKKLLPSHVKIIDSGEAVARQTKAVLEANQLLNNKTIEGANKLYTNGKKTVMEALLNPVLATTIQTLDF
ncbi:glutamate racemase [Flavobacteriaceae bacterium]|jgi:glutamate racemase|nr:glutamate racemase [Flavobacteriaceae bacterium]MDB4108119.1 glutamate racemase [Flavobacteriaceae bacterium]MDB4183134.1 glutamate racemase [Flavobacteriaceae bacterium]MDC0117834.1 glutamate racemase [bacterium]